MADARSSSSVSDTSSGVEALYQVKLLSALRSGDPAAIHPFLQEISKDRQKSGGTEIDTGAAALHLAVRCGSPATVSLLLAHRAISPNGVHPPGSGTTPLHLAASLGRVDIVNLLLEQEHIDDGLRDNHGKTCRDLARGKDVVRAIDDSRSFLNASYRSLLRTYILSPPSEPPSAALIHLLESPRAKFVDLSYLDDDSGTSLLHEAARRKDLRLIELAVRAGADVFIRNRKGKMAYEGAGKDDRVKVFLRQFANQDKTLIPSPVPNAEPPTLKGYLNKYTNVAKGYNTRWFVLKNGVLSYYRHQDDESISSRGSISMKNALLRIGERTRFEVHSLPSRGSHSAGSSTSTQKWYMKANHPVEANRWTQAITASIEWYKAKDVGESDASSVMSNGFPRRKSAESDSGISALKSTFSGGSQSIRLSTQVLKKKKASVSSRHGPSDSTTTIPPASQAPAMPPAANANANDIAPLVPPDADDDLGMAADEEDEDEEGDESSSADSTSRSPPHPSWELSGNAAFAQLELTQQLFINFTLPPSAPARLTETHEALKESLVTTQSLLSEYMSIAREREEWYAKQLKKERTRQRFWEESLATVVKEGETLEKELRTRSRRRGSKVFSLSPSASVGANDPTFALPRKRRSSLLAAGSFEVPDVPTPVVEEQPLTSPSAPTPIVKVSHVDATTTSPSSPTSAVTPPLNPPPAPRQPARSDTVDTLTVRSPPPPPSAKKPLRERSVPALDDYADDDEYDTADEDEFFDAIESGNLPNLIMHESLTSPTLRSPSLGAKSPTPSSAVVVAKPPSPPPPYMASSGSTGNMYAGYVNLRSKLGLKADERPSTSLWSVLKHSIGKDLTKISFPVFFNEPTSMLQRMAEDMEFSECLDIAAQEKDPLRRIAFVSAFAMSNYSSTIGRIAKPFNPMLSETFEYVRLDKQYRYVSEQVSHHPPISACWAESPTWHYYGEVDAQNKFMGKSFEIRPTGVAHTDLLLPEEYAPEYPRATAPGEKGKVVEHYSWKKVTTNVSGFILGSPTIDHYGDMVVTNHRTGDQCILTFKPRGWRGKDAYEISGQVIDSNGDVAYEIAGRWNSQLVARRVGSGSGVLNPDMTIAAPHSPSAVPEYILLWRNSEKPVGSPFNLTPFAITLNELSLKDLKPYLAPTDCRLRVDQRAFELGRYELANELKHEQEEKQRSIRRARAEGRMEAHRPRWFVAETEGDTGERVWAPVRDEKGQLEYWSERERVWKTGGKAKWREVDDIFIEEPEEIKELMERTMA